MTSQSFLPAHLASLHHLFSMPRPTTRVPPSLARLSRRTRRRHLRRLRVVPPLKRSPILHFADHPEEAELDCPTISPEAWTLHG